MTIEIINSHKIRIRRIKLVGSPGSVALARAYVKDTLDEWGYSHPDFQADATLIVSELVTNAVRVLDVLHNGCRDKHPLHRPHLIRLDLRELPRRLRIGVWDSVTYIPEICAMPSPDALSGRGLPIVDELAEEVGVRRVKDPEIGGKVVYATLAYP